MQKLVADGIGQACLLWTLHRKTGAAHPLAPLRFQLQFTQAIALIDGVRAQIVTAIDLLALAFLQNAGVRIS